MLEESPNLVELTLRVDNHAIVLEMLVDLDNPLENLRKLKLHGHPPGMNLYPDDSPSLHPLRLFLEKHPRIEDLQLMWRDCVGCPRDNFDLSMIIGTPSLKRFTGPAKLCAGILLAEPRAHILESITITYTGCTHGETLYHYKDIDSLGLAMHMGIDSTSNTRLPHLKALIFEPGPVEPASYSDLQQMLRAAPALVNLELGCFRVELVCFKF